MDQVFIDLRKAFDSGPSKGLLMKLRSHGVSNDIYDWIQGFLAGRTQHVILDRGSSIDVAVNSGVPQGRVLGPLLFINYLADNITCTLRLFSDDAVIYHEVRSERRYTYIQSDLSKVSEIDSLL